jgi:predicted Ser/Thr protein kinase
MKKTIRHGIISLALGLLVSLTASGKELPNRVKILNTEMKKCEASVKKFADHGYPAKAEKQLLECKRIQGELAKIEAGRAKIDRKLASLSPKKKPIAHKKASRKQRKHH